MVFRAGHLPHKSQRRARGTRMILKLKRTPAIYLVGFMGCGKSTVGRALADELGWSFHDLDEDIERLQSVSVAEIFDTLGEPAFREIETDALRDRVRAVQSGRPQVISLGGGTFLRDENFELVSNNGVTVWLDCPFSMIERRVSSQTHRPLARDPEQLVALFEARKPGYSRADFRVEIADDDIRAAVSRILALPLF
jgi:shikimate kinase